MIYKYTYYLPKKCMGDGKTARYFTPIKYSSPYEAKMYNAIPYEPLYRLKISPKSVDSFGEEFPNENTKKRRVWAAFGYHGGSYEMKDRGIYILNEKEKATDSNYAGAWSIDATLFSGGYTEEYATFIKDIDIEYGRLLHELLEEAITEFTEYLKDKYFDKKNVDHKMLEDLSAGVVYYKREPYEYTISILAYANECVLNGLKIWGVFWCDKDSSRKISRFIQYVIPGCPLLASAELMDTNRSNEFKAFIKRRFDDVRHCLHRKGTHEDLTEFRGVYLQNL